MQTSAIDEKPCSTCGAPLMWMKHEKSGKPAPINLAPSANGNILPDTAAGTYRIVPPADRPQYTGRLHTNHFMDCPQARFHARNARGS